MDTFESTNRIKTIATVATICVIIGIVVIIEVVQNNAKKSVVSTTSTSSTTSSTTPSSTPSTGTDSTSTTTPTTTATTNSYKDGTYTADATYYVPHGSEDISVTLTVADGVVTNSTITNSESDPDSARYQENFASAYKSDVVGKNLADINLSYVAGASDTSQGFDDAIAQIRTQSQA